MAANFSDAADQVVGGSSANNLAGIAVLGYSENAAQGQWQYSSNNGSSWQTLASVASSAASARTVASSDLLRFLPAANFFGTTPALTIALVDSSTSVNTGATINAAQLAAAAQHSARQQPR